MHQFINIIFYEVEKKVKINNYTLGMELEVCYLIKKILFFKSKSF